jgi:prevent-host-death family protein
MRQKYSIAQARAPLASIIHQVEAGTPVELTRRGKTVAVMLSCRDYERLSGRPVSFKDTCDAFLKKYDLKKIGIGKRFLVGIRDMGPGRKVRL